MSKKKATPTDIARMMGKVKWAARAAEMKFDIDDIDDIDAINDKLAHLAAIADLLQAAKPTELREETLNGVGCMIEKLGREIHDSLSQGGK